MTNHAPEKNRRRARVRLIAATGLTLLLAASLAGGTVSATPTSAKSAKKGKKKRGGDLVSKFDSRVLASGFDKPIAFDYLPNGRMLVAEKNGRLYIADPGGDKRLLLDISGHIVTDRERGLEGVEVDHNFAQNRRVYLLYAFKADALRPTEAQALRLTSITLNPDDTLANPGKPETVILGKDIFGPCPAVTNRRDCPTSIAATHQGGTVLSAPDGTLFVGFGDSNLPDVPGRQVFRTYNPKSTAGKILHIDQNGNGLPSHPFCRKDKNLTHTCTKVYAVGFRNPFRFTLTPGGDPIVADVGWNAREEINLVKRGKNYGWPCFEGSRETNFYRELKRCKGAYRKPKRFSKPVYEYPNNSKLGGAAAIMGPFYDDGLYPNSVNRSYFFGDYASRFIKEAVLRKGKFKGIRTVATEVFPVQLRRAPSGNVAYVDFAFGTVNELVYSPGNKAPLAEIVAHRTSGPAPLAVAFSGVKSTDPEGGLLSYFWNFGDGGSSTSPTPNHLFANGTYTVKLTVTDAAGASNTTAIRISSGNSAPNAVATAPKPHSFFQAGRPVQLAATGSDPDDGALPSSAFSWDVTLVHKDHRHVLGSVTGNPTTFQAVTDHDADSYYEIAPRVTDSQGLTTQLPLITIQPEAVKLKIRSNVKGAKLSYGGRGIGSKKTVQAVIGFRANLSAPRSIKRGGRKLNFKRWSQGGSRVQIFEIPSTPTTIRAIYGGGGNGDGKGKKKGNKK